MKIVNTYSFKDGEKFINSIYPKELDDVIWAIENLDATTCLTKESKEKTMKGKLLFSPRDLNDNLKMVLHKRRWTEKAQGKMKKFVSFLFFLFILPAILVSAYVSFSDVPDTYLYAEAIDYAYESGIVSGYSDGSYLPDNPINRAEFTKVVINSKFGESDIQGCEAGKTFPDVKESDWYYPYVCVASNYGIINGYPDGSFKPGNNINFVEAAKIIVNTFGYKVSASEIWYKPFVEVMETTSAIPGTIYSFERNITRGEMAEMVYRLREGIENKMSTHFFTDDADLVINGTFVKAYRFYNDNSGLGIWPTKDNNYIFAGWTTPRLDDDGFISKLNSQGEIVWTRLVGSKVHYSGPMGAGPALDVGYLATQLEDDSYLFAGQTNGYVGDAEAAVFEVALDVFLSNFDENGNHLWTKTVGDLAGDTPVGLWPAEDGGFLLLLTLEELNAGAAEVGDTDHYFALAKFDAEGEKEWIKKTNLNIGQTMGDSEQVNFFIEYEGGDGFVLVGSMSSGEVLKTEDEEVSSDMSAIVKLDKNGELLWAKSIESVPTEYLIPEPADNEVGYITNYIAFRLPAGDFSAVQKTSDGGSLAIGFVSPFVTQGYTNYDPTYETLMDTPFLAVKFDEDGEFKWAKTLETGLLTFDKFFKIAKTPDNDFVIMFNYISGGEQYLGDPYDTYMEKAEQVYDLCKEKDCKPGDELTDPELKALYDEMNEAQDQWAATFIKHIALIKVDNEFNVKWVRKIGPKVDIVDIRQSVGNPYQFEGNDIRITNDQGIIIAGSYGSDDVCSSQFGIDYYCNDALLVKLDINGNLVDNSGLVSSYVSVSQEDLSQYIVLRDLEPEIVNYNLGMGVKGQSPSVSAKTVKAITVLSPFTEETVVLNEQEPIFSVVSPEVAPEPKTQAYIYYESVESVEPEGGSSSDVHQELLPILNEVFNGEVKLWDSFGGFLLDYSFGRLVTEDDILAVQEGLERLGYSLAMGLEEGKIVMSKTGRVLNLLFSVGSRMKGTLEVTW